MSSVHVHRALDRPDHWDVYVDERREQRFACPVAALLHAKAVYEELRDGGEAALLIDFGGHHETQLLPR